MSVLKKCKNCKKEFEPKNSFHSTCSVECAISILVEKKKKKESSEWRKRKSEIREKIKTVSDYRKDARFWFQRWIRMRDVGKTCISCGTLLTEITKFDAGHYYSASGTPQLLFNEINCSGQCVFCNQHKSGNLIEYRKGIISRYGIDKLMELENIAEFKGKRIHTKEYYVDIAEEYKKRCKKLENIK